MQFSPIIKESCVPIDSDKHRDPQLTNVQKIGDLKMFKPTLDIYIITSFPPRDQGIFVEGRIKIVIVPCFGEVAKC